MKGSLGSTTVLCDGGPGLKRKAQSPISPSPYLHQLTEERQRPLGAAEAR
jgi:hypothetical protein